jgi:hypothetical protein
MLDSQQDLLQRHRLRLLAPSKRCRQAFVLCNITKAISIGPTVNTSSAVALLAPSGRPKQHIPKKYSTSARSVVPASESPKTIIGAASSPRLNSSVVAVKV